MNNENYKTREKRRVREHYKKRKEKSIKYDALRAIVAKENPALLKKFDETYQSKSPITSQKEPVSVTTHEHRTSTSSHNMCLHRDSTNVHTSERLDANSDDPFLWASTNPNLLSPLLTRNVFASLRELNTDLFDDQKEPVSAQELNTAPNEFAQNESAPRRTNSPSEILDSLL